MDNSPYQSQRLHFVQKLIVDKIEPIKEKMDRNPRGHQSDGFDTCVFPSSLAFRDFEVQGCHSKVSGRFDSPLPMAHVVADRSEERSRQHERY